MRKLKTTIVKDPFGVRDIPDVMRDKLGWEKSAELMKKWFSLDAKVMSKDEKGGEKEYDSNYIDKTLFTWEWLEQFNRVNEGLEELNETIYSSNAKNALEENFEKYIKNSKIAQFPAIVKSSDYKNDPVKLHELWQFQYKIIGYEFNVVDDLYGSLGNFLINAAISEAKIEKVDTNIYRIIISKVVFYMRDTFDFIGNQYLGHWDYEGMGITLLAGASNKIDSFEWSLPAWNPTLGIASSFGNSDFNEYRERNKKGGDLLLFSDLKEIDISNKPIIIEVSL